MVNAATMKSLKELFHELSNNKVLAFPQSINPIYTLKGEEKIYLESILKSWLNVWLIISRLK